LPNITQSICTVIPPHMHQHAAAHGGSRQRERIRATLAHTVELAAMRAATVIEPPRGAPAQKRRQVYDARHQQMLPGRLVMTENGARSSDIAAQEAFDGAGATYDFLAQVFLRNSIDDRGMRLDATIHYGTHYDNALWTGGQMVYGDGDGKLFNRFTRCVEITGHEYTHGLTQFTSGLEYHGQPGALNEHLSDATGIMIKQYRFGITAARSNWRIGDGLLARGVRGLAVRLMDDPGGAYDDPVLGKDPQPGHMRNYVDDADDNGGVHINSGIPNRAFCLAAKSIGGFAWTVTGRIWYRAATGKLFPKAGFQDFADATVSAAGELYGIGGSVQLTIADAWSEVGLHVPMSLTRSGRGWGNLRRTSGSATNA
jgi:Zn-dependent metalloprotease